ncbi:MAG: hypothetical protein L6R37_008406 [Teloschistes peruensis]|nr:MAG: hypothetical protein L6R37_008406 [Teloschistes peruensis]
MIRLLKADSCELPTGQKLQNPQTTSYVIISHAWQEQEVVYEDMPQFKALGGEKSASAAKIRGACRKALDHRFEYLWLDTICIDKKNLTELSMSINSMYRWYQRASICFAYLEDYPSKSVSVFTESRWFTRGWTLQELVAPKDVIFFDKNWNTIGNKKSLQTYLTSRTQARDGNPALVWA